jgi:predicted DCC family thiol-disulfide oxidoreductase YuxK
VKIPDHGGTILFDGVCNLCERSVRFVIRHDPGAKFMFAPLQSAYAHTLIMSLEISLEELAPDDYQTFFLITDGKVSSRSDAWLNICRQLDGWPGLLRIFRFVPRFIRDAIYDLIGRHRYQWFGKKPECMVPAPDIQLRFKK